MDYRGLVYAIAVFMIPELLYCILVIISPRHSIYIAQELIDMTGDLVRKTGIIYSYPLAAISILIFSGTWALRWIAILRLGGGPPAVTSKALLARIFLLFTWIAMLAKSYIYNGSDKSNFDITRFSIAIELLFCWVMALILVDTLFFLIRVIRMKSIGE